ncbi:MAG: 3,4-dihydroxy-2-butanone-4-phosphate synthase [Novosphingobium sp.]
MHDRTIDRTRERPADAPRARAEPRGTPAAEKVGPLQRLLDSAGHPPATATIEEIIDEARNGRMFILVDDEDRENEGDLILPAQMATPDAINFMATHGRGLICLALTRERTEALGLELMSRNNRTRHETAFTVSIEARDGVTTGISAADRARTVNVAIDPTRSRDELVTPGHVFPLIARDGGVLIRAGHTEAAVDIARLAGLNPSGVICEVMKDDGTMARLGDLVGFARRHDLKIGTIRDLIAYRRRHDHLVERVAESRFVSDHGGEWRLITYRNRIDGSDTFVLQKGEVVPGRPTLVRVQTLSLLDDMLGKRGPHQNTLQRAMAEIGREGAGIVVLLQRPPQEAGADEDAISPDAMLRTYGVGAQILADLAVHEMILLTVHHRSVVAIEGYGIAIVEERLLTATEPVKRAAGASAGTKKDALG